LIPAKFPAYHFLGMRIEPLTKADLLNVIQSTVDSNLDNSIIGNHNMHSLYLLHHNAEMRHFYDENRHTHVDGMPIILLARMLGIPLHRVHRTGYLDWFEAFLCLAEDKSWRIYFLGGRPDVAAGIPARIRSDWPRLEIRSHHGYDAFSPTTSVYAEIEAFAPHIVLVGMGMPLQEKWILEARGRIHANLFLQCGAIMDYFMGAQKAAPRWLGQIGFEWLYRLMCRPKALYRRYLVEPLALSPMVLREVATRRTHFEK
jgi:N-acetylglucosaminyldiphosphoundecaprenol N-acetyl-beta-D-mannosaminyltransferase